MKIGIDIDDTLTNTRREQKKKWLLFIKEHPNKNYSKELPNNINDFGDDYIQLFWDTYRENLSFKCTFKKNASLILNLLKEKHNLCIITSRPSNKYKNLKPRLKEWLKLNNIPIDEIYTDIKDKASFCLNNHIDLLIDDNLKHCNKANELNIKTILFNRNPNYHNYQANTWLKVYSIINKIEKEKRT